MMPILLITAIASKIGGAGALLHRRIRPGLFKADGDSLVVNLSTLLGGQIIENYDGEGE